MATPITKTSYIDNFDSEIPGHVEVGYGNRKAWIEFRTLKIVNPKNIPLTATAMAYAVSIADEYNCWETDRFGKMRRNHHKPMSLSGAKKYLKNVKEKGG